MKMAIRSVTILVWTVTITAALFLTFAVHPQAVHPADGNPQVWAGDYTTRVDLDWDSGGVSILTYIILHSLQSDRLLHRPPEFTSFHRIQSCPRSQHCYGNAVDFYFSYATAHSDCEVWKLYRDDILEFERGLRDNGIADLVGFGVYHNRTMHLDFRGHHARWGFDADKNQLSFDKLMEELDAWIVESCSNL